ncbi:MAG TPA: Gfo/Idh/MocA family oxidoreductase [Candidatus Didemnitutus sp.]|nr:Gfo/Idh/MocA family oxidoreductase [Candidatus Didemnitutus sp.]
MSTPLRIGLIGAGGNTRLQHLPGFKAIPGVEVVAVSNRSRESAEKVAKEFAIPRVAATWQEIVEDKGIDAVCIGTWPNMHAKMTVAALRAGKHVLCEARMARSLAEAELMLAESNLNPNLVAQLVPAPMSFPLDATIDEILASGVLGPIREVHLNCTTGGLADAATPASWRQDHSLSGKNSLYLGIYYEMALRWTGREVSSLVADAAIFTKQRNDTAGRALPMLIPESLTILGRYHDDSRLIANFSGVETTAPRAEARLNGTKGGLRVDLTRGELWKSDAAGREQRVEIAPEKKGSWRVEADFVESIRERKPVTLTSFAAGVRYMRFTEAVWESWNNDRARVVL